MSTLHDLVHHGIKAPHSWPVIADAFEEHGHPEVAEVFRSKRVLPRDPSYWMDNEDNYEVAEHLDGPYHTGYSVVGRGDTEPLSSHTTHQAATEAIQDRVADKNSTIQEVIDHVRENGKEIAPGVHLVDDGKHVHLHDFRHIDTDDEYDPDTLRPVASFVKGKRFTMSRRTDKSKRAKITGLTAGGDCEHCGKKDVALIHVKGEDSGKEIKLGSTCAGKLCHTTTGEKLHREKLVRHGHSMNTLKKAGHEPVYPTIMYDSDALQLARDPEFLAKLKKLDGEQQKRFFARLEELEKEKYGERLGTKNPVMLYHGSPHDLKELKATEGQRANTALFGFNYPVQNQGVFLSDSPRVARYFGQNRADNPSDAQVHKVYANLDKILDLTGKPGIWRKLDDPKYVEKIKAKGYHGAKFREDAHVRKATDPKAHSYIIFDPEKHTVVHRAENRSIKTPEDVEAHQDRFLRLARHVTELAHAFNPDKSPKAYADALAEVGHPLALFVRRAKAGLPLIRTAAGHEFSGAPGQRGRKEIHVPRVRELESPDLGIHRVGFHYDPSAGAGHIVVTMKTKDPTSSREITWHAPATKAELKGLGLKNRRMKLARSQFQGFDRDTEALLPQATIDPVTRGIVADRLEELGDPLHHVFRAPDARPELDRRSRDVHHDLQYYPIRKRKNLGDLHLVLYHSPEDNHIIIEAATGHRKTKTRRQTMGAVTPEQAKEIIAYHYNGRGKLPRRRTYGPIDHQVRFKPIQLARPDVIADGMSNQQTTRRKLAAKIALQAGLKLQQLINARTQSQAGVLQTYGHENEPDAVDYAAAWYGLLSRSPRLTSFHVHDGGPDTYHTWKTGLDPDRVLEAAQGLGLNAVVTSDGAVAVLDAGNQAATPISALKEATYARAPLSEPGTAKAFGSRDDYRNSIRAYERSVLGDRPSPPATAGGPVAA